MLILKIKKCTMFLISPFIFFEDVENVNQTQKIKIDSRRKI